MGGRDDAPSARRRLGGRRYDVAEAGAQGAGRCRRHGRRSVRAVAEQAPDPHHLAADRRRLRGGERRARGRAGSGQIIVECSTFPSTSSSRAPRPPAGGRENPARLPISGTGSQAAVKDLIMLGSGDAAAFERCRPALAAVSRVQRHLGAFGNGTRMKLIANLLVTVHNAATAEALVLGMKAGSIRRWCSRPWSTAPAARARWRCAAQMVANRYDEKTATLDILLKDIGIIGRFADSLHAPTPLFGAAAALYHAGANQGRGDDDPAAVCAVYETMAGIKRS